MKHHNQPLRNAFQKLIITLIRPNAAVRDTFAKTSPLKNIYEPILKAYPF